MRNDDEMVALETEVATLERALEDLMAFFDFGTEGNVEFLGGTEDGTAIIVGDGCREAVERAFDALNADVPF